MAETLKLKFSPVIAYGDNSRVISQEKQEVTLTVCEYGSNPNFVSYSIVKLGTVFELKWLIDQSWERLLIGSESSAAFINIIPPCLWISNGAAADTMRIMGRAYYVPGSLTEITCMGFGDIVGSAGKSVYVTLFGRYDSEGKVVLGNIAGLTPDFSDSSVIFNSGIYDNWSVTNRNAYYAVYGNWKFTEDAEDAKVTDLDLTPYLQDISKGESIQFTLEATYDDGTIEDVTSDALWGLGNNTIEEPVSELNGFTISSSGLLTAIDPTSPSIVVSGKFGGLGAYTTVTISGPHESGPYESGGFSGPGGGGGTFPSSPGPSLVDKIPAGQTGNDLANSGLFTMYLMNQQYMNLIGNIMWEDNLGIQALKAVFGQPIDAIISTMSYPFDLTNFVSKTAQNLYFGPWNSGLTFQALTKSSFQINWGTINIPFGWGNFLDYAPYTKMELFLPWGPGYVPIDPNDVSPFSNTPGNFNVSTFTNGSIQVKTNIELGKGTCVHNVIGNNGKVIGSYSGVVGKQVPMTALDTGGKIITTIGAVAAMTPGAVTAAGAMAGKFNTGQVASHKQLDPLLNRPMFADAGYVQKASEGASTVNRGANMAASALLSHPISFPRAGTFSDGSSALTVQCPFLLVSRPVQSVPAQYGHYNGYPSNIHYANLSALSGYTEISEIHLDNVTATADELSELDAVLKGGILL